MSSTPAERSKVFVAHDAANEGSFTGLDWLLFAAISATWGASFLFIDIGLDAMAPTVVTLSRVSLGALALAVLPRQKIPVEPGDRGLMVLLAFVWIALPFTLFPLAQEHINSAVAGLMNGATPILSAVVAAIFLKQRPTGYLLAGIIIGFAGVALIALPSLSEGSSEALGIALVLGATVCYGIAVNITPPLQAKYGPVNLMAKLLAIATVMVAPLGLLDLGETQFDLGAWAAIAVLGVIGTGIAFALMAMLVGRVGSTRSTFITYIVPVVALGLGVVFRDDEVASLALGGVALVLVGAFLASQTTSKAN